MSATATIDTGREFAQRCDELADWSMRRLVNRSDAWGEYLPLHARNGRGSAITQRGELTAGIIARHYVGADQGHLIGLHAIDPAGNTCRWLAIDIDAHGDAGEPTRQRNWLAAKVWADKLESQELHPIIIDSNGKGGFHLLILLDSPLDAGIVYRFAQHLIADWQIHGLTEQPETFPKQPALSGKGLGNWLRLPGRHHTNGHWSRVSDGEFWREGSEAIDLLINAPVSSAKIVELLAPEKIEQPAQQTQQRERDVPRDLRVAADALAHTPNNGETHYDLWISVGMALHSIAQTDETLKLWTDWSRKSPKHVDGECEKHWSSFDAERDKRYTLGTLIKLSRDNGHDPVPHTDTGSLPLTEYGNAQRLAYEYRDRIRWHAERGLWLIHSGPRWEDDHTGAVVRFAKKIVRAFYATAGKTQDSDTKEALLKHATRSEKAAAIDAMIKLARSEPQIAVTSDQLDANPWHLNTLTGTLDLHAPGRLLAHDPEHLITKLAPVEFDPAATCPLWTAFLERIMAGNAEMIGYLQRLAGLWLTADISVQELWIFHGGGANGKNVFIDTISGLLGEYAGPAPDGLLTVRSHDEHPTEIADLLGKRMVVASELEEGARLKTSLAKRLTGDLTLKARFMRMDYFEFRRTHKLVIVTNSRPVISENTNAIWRRVRLVPFAVTIPQEEWDLQLTDKLRAEWPGILNWAIRGCIDWQEGGMRPPHEVLVASAEYQAEQDVLADFLADRCVRGDGCRVTRNDLFSGYQTWCDQTHEPHPLDRTNLFERIRRVAGVDEGQWREAGRTAPSRGFRGIGLQAEGTFEGVN